MKQTKQNKKRSNEDELKDMANHEHLSVDQLVEEIINSAHFCVTKMPVREQVILDACVRTVRVNHDI